MKEGAIVLNGVQLVKIVKNKKFNKLVNNPNMKILEECSMEMLDEKYNYWKNLLNREVEKEIEETKMYHFKNSKTGETIDSIYPSLDKLRQDIKDIDAYDRLT